MSNITQTFTRAAASALVNMKHNSPHLFFGAGVGGVGLATFLACKSTLKVEPVLDVTKISIEEARAAGPYSSHADETKAIALEYVKGGVELAKLYAPAAVIGGLAIGSLTGAHIQLHKRNVALSAGFAVLSRAFDEYRSRVREEFGTDKELDIYRGTETQTIKHKDGTKELVKVQTKPGLSPYRRCFDETSPNWEKNAELNRMFVQVQQDILNHDLQSKGHVFLNEAYKALGFEETEVGQLVGWYLNGEGDNYIDFGLHEIHNSAFGPGGERSAWLDFNVDGPIANRLETI